MKFFFFCKKRAMADNANFAKIYEERESEKK